MVIGGGGGSAEGGDGNSRGRHQRNSSFSSGFVVRNKVVLVIVYSLTMVLAGSVLSLPLVLSVTNTEQTPIHRQWLLQQQATSEMKRGTKRTSPAAKKSSPLARFTDDTIQVLQRLLHPRSLSS